MVDTSIYYQKQPWYSFTWADEEEDEVEIFVPPHRPSSSTVPSDRPSSSNDTTPLGQVLRMMDEKRSRRLSIDDDETDHIIPTPAAADDTQAWARIGYAVLIGLIIAVLGTTLRFIVTGPVPFAVAALGMLFVVVALWHGGKLERSQPS